MIKIIFFAVALILLNNFFAQNFESFFTGNHQNKDTIGKGGICLMGGASEHDNAMRWFLNQANGGDILVLRTSGSDGYNTYLYSDLGINVNSVETILFNNANASFDSYVLDKIKNAEGIWFAGGDQWEYISYFRNTAIDSLINEGISNRKIVLGGTSAGMAIQGKYYFSAENGTITSEEALINPFDANLTIGSEEFIKNPYLSNHITDTHFDNPDRKGRLVSFLARIQQDFGSNPKAIACNEYTAVCIDSSGIASVFGDYPNYDEFAYFVELNCEIQNNVPENCSSNQTLTWSQNNEALKVHRIGGKNDGTPKFDVKNWLPVNDDVWLNWSVIDGVFQEVVAEIANCFSANQNVSKTEMVIFPNPAFDKLYLNLSSEKIIELKIQSMDGKIAYEVCDLQQMKELNVEFLDKGTYLLKCTNENNVVYRWKFNKI